MTATRTPSESGAYSRRKGVVAERDLCRWLRANGFPTAERAVATGFRVPQRVSKDPGDVRGTRICWSVKSCSEERLRAWFVELDAMDVPPDAPRLLVQKRAGHAGPARWWCWQRLEQLADIVDPEGFVSVRASAADYPVRMELGHVVPLLRAAGWGDAPEVAP